MVCCKHNWSNRFPLFFYYFFFVLFCFDTLSFKMYSRQSLSPFFAILCDGKVYGFFQQDSAVVCSTLYNAFGDGRNYFVLWLIHPIDTI